MAYTQDDVYLSVSTPLETDKLILRGLTGEERISAPFAFTLDMISEDGALDFTALVGASATVTIDLADGTTKRYVNGIITRFVQAGSDATFTTYRAELRPWLWLCTLAADCKVYQNKTVTDIITGLFTELGFTDFKNSCTGTYTALEYCVQYQETAFDFVSRLMEEHGIHYYFEHEDGTHTLVLSDDSAAAVATPGLTAARCRLSGSSSNEEDVILSAVLEKQVVSGKYAVEDYAFTTPATDLLSTQASTAATKKDALRFYEYQTGHVDTGGGEARAKLRLEALEAAVTVLRGTANCRAFIAGYKTTVKDHPRTDVNADWTLVAVVHTATREAYQNSFEAIPLATPYRPRRMTRKPVIPGAQTAVVVGPSGEEIHTDAHGRIKVQFHWDQVGAKDENSSCWIRVEQSWAGKAWGALFLPRIGQEVVVTFLDGDPDRPLVTGAVYNGTNTPPYTLPTDMTKSTIKGKSTKTGGDTANEIRFEDKKDSEELYLHAQKDMTVKVLNDRKTDVLHDETVTVKNARTTTIQEADESLTVSKGNRTVKVETGNETHEVKGTRGVTVTGDETHTNKAKFTHTVDGDYELTVKGKLTITVTGDIAIHTDAKWDADSTGDMTNKSAAKVTTEAGTALKNKSGTTLDNEAGTALTNKAGTALTNEAGTGLTNKAGTALESSGGVSAKVKGSASGEFDGGGAATVKGGMVKVN
ncbi:MAG: type VI secretion system tip protein VgrG [Candidatus Rokubacteria bacterium]|nr:type VI secretion system tip protein VgrG [Candidatus Rokubacteria bacterium]